MLNIFRSFLKTAFKNWYQTLAFLLFIVMTSSLSISFLSNSLPTYSKATYIENNTNKWSAQYNISMNDYYDDFIYKYYQNELDEYDLKENEFNTPLLNMNLIINQHISLKDYLEQAFNDYQKDFYDNSYQKFIGNFIKTNVLSFDYLRNNHEVELPLLLENQPNFISVPWNKIVNQQWHELFSYEFTGTDALNRFVTKLYNYKFNQNISIDANMFLYYKHINPKLRSLPIEFRIEGVNYQQKLNVVSQNLSDEQLKNLKNNEIIITDKFAHKYNLKIGDNLIINDPKYENSLVETEYKIVGFGNKNRELFLQRDPDLEIIYVNNQELKNYLKTLWLNFNQKGIFSGIVNEDNLGVYQYNMYSNNSPTQNIEKFNRYANDVLHAKRINDYILYQDLLDVKILNIQLIQNIVFIIAGLIALLLVLVFGNFTIKKELKQIVNQIGLFKAMGYKNIELGSTLALRSFLIIIVGFIVGYLVSLPIQIFVNKTFAETTAFYVDPIWTNAWFLLIIFLVVPFTLALVNLGSITRYLSMNSLLMIQMNGASSFVPRNLLKFKMMNYHLKVSKHLSFIKSFSLKQVLKLTLMSSFFVLGFLMILLMFNFKTLIFELTHSDETIFNQSLNHRISANWWVWWNYNVDLDKYYLINPLKINKITYDNFEQLNNFDNLSGMDDTLKTNNLNFEESLNHYFNLERNEQSKPLILTDLAKILNTNLNYKIVNLVDFQKLIVHMTNDYEKYFQDDFPDLKDNLDSIKNDLIKNFDFLTSRLVNPQTKLTFNNLLIEKNVDYPLLMQWLPNQNIDLYKSPNRWRISFLNDYNKDIYKLKHYALLKESSVQNDALPVLVSKYFALFNELNVGEIIEAKLDEDDDSTVYFKLKIIGIEEDQIAQNNIYSLWSDWKTFTNDSTPNEVYNSIWSKRDILQPVDENYNNFKINTNYFNFLNENNYFTIYDFLSDSDSFIDFYNWNALNIGSNFSNFKIEDEIISRNTQEFNGVINIFLSFTILIILILITNLSFINTIDNKTLITNFKALGYSNQYINFKLLKKYLITMLIGLVIAIVLSYFIWKIGTNIFVKQVHLIVNSPFSLIPILIISLILITTYLISWFSSYYIIKKTKPY